MIREIRAVRPSNLIMNQKYNRFLFPHHRHRHLDTAIVSERRTKEKSSGVCYAMQTKVFFIFWGYLSKVVEGKKALHIGKHTEKLGRKKGHCWIPENLFSLFFPHHFVHHLPCNVFYCSLYNVLLLFTC